MRDDFTRDEAGAAAHAQILGAHEHIGGGVESPIVKPVCIRCQNGVRGYICGPCMRDEKANETEHEHGREESGRVIRVACSCGWRGRWRSRTAFLVDKQLHSDDGEHLSMVRRGLA